jgi:hypothetical protein
MNKDYNPTKSVEEISKVIFRSLAQTFPITCASDEFYYFPQVYLPDLDQNTWDHFSSETIINFIGKFSKWKEELNLLLSNQKDFDTQIDILLLKNLISTLREQLEEVRVWEYQPTFYLTIACVGLAEALESGEPNLINDRVNKLPAFLDQASQNLKKMPELFKEIGLEMIPDVMNYFNLLKQSIPAMDPSLIALDRFEKVLNKVSTRKDFNLPQELLERIISSHLQCDMDIENINHHLEKEIEEMQQLLNQYAKSINANPPKDESWLEVLKKIAPPEIPKNGLVNLYRSEVNKLAQHCNKKGFIKPEMFSSCPVSVAPMPSFLSAIRTASSYSISPKHPPDRGLFYILNTQLLNEEQKMYHREYRMLSAHETYPGHHLLDSSRWYLAKPVRRFLEFPIYYEGWACFAEELMKLTGFFSNPTDFFLLAKRRLWRAVRGKIDIGLQTGKINFATAVKFLQETGLSAKQAYAVVRKYPLNPGYQLCYTIGLRKFLEIFNEFSKNNFKSFVHTVLNQGEIGFSNLKKILNQLNH